MSSQRIADCRRRYAALYSEEPTPIEIVHDIESALQVSLPDDMKEVARYYGGGILGGIEHTAIEAVGPGGGIVDVTLAFRTGLGLPNRFVVLADHSESVIVLDVDSGAITWLDSVEVDSLVDGQPLVGWKKSWASYSEFFEYMLDKEERERSDHRTT